MRSATVSLNSAVSPPVPPLRPLRFTFPSGRLSVPRAVYICQKLSRDTPPPPSRRRSEESLSSARSMGCRTGSWFTKRARQNISRIVHVRAINQVAVAGCWAGWEGFGAKGGVGGKDDQEPCFCNKVRVVSDLCAISPPGRCQEQRDTKLLLLSLGGFFCGKPPPPWSPILKLICWN